MTGISLEHKGHGVPRPTRGQAVRPRSEPFMLRHPEARRLASLSFAADKDYLGLARMTAMHVAGLLGLPIGRVTDLRLAVDEACSIFLSAAPADPMAALNGPSGQLSLRFDRIEGPTPSLRIRCSGPAPQLPPEDGDLGWMLLSALVDGPQWEARDGVGTLTMIEPIPTGRR